MGFIDVLRKIGLFRSGTVAAKYNNAKERPIELQDSGVFNSKKDLITKTDLTKKNKNPKNKSE